MKDLIKFIIENYIVIIAVIVGIYELLARYIPTIKKWSILTLIIGILKFIVPDRKKTGNGRIERHN